MSRSRNLTLGKYFELELLWHYKFYIIVMVVAIAGFAFGYVGFEKYYAANNIPKDWVDLAYEALQLFVLQSGNVPGRKPWELQVARFFLPLVAAYTIGRVISLFFIDKINVFKVLFMGGHIILCGLGWNGQQMVKSLMDEGRKIVIVEKDENARRFQSEMNVNGSRKETIKDKIWRREINTPIIIIGDATKRITLFKAGIERASALIAMCGNDNTNAEISLVADEITANSAKRTGEKFRCFVNTIDTTLCANLNQGIAGDKCTVNTVFFNVDEIASRLILNKHPPEIYSMGDTVHMAVVGFGPGGENLVLQALKVGHYTGNRKLHITVFDEKVKEEYFRARYPEARNISDIELDFIDVTFDSSGTFNTSKMDSIAPVDVFYMCLDDDAKSISCGLTVNKHEKGRKAQIIINAARETGFVRLLDREEKFKRKNRIELIEPLIDADIWEMLSSGKLDIMAQQIHEKHIQKRREDDTKGTRKWDDNDPTLERWESCTDANRDSNRQAADHINVKLRAIGCEIVDRNDVGGREIVGEMENVEELAKTEHYRWNAERFLNGWTYGPTTIKDSKIHNCLIEWKKMEEKDREYDRNQVRAIPEIVEKAYRNEKVIVRNPTKEQ